MVYLPSIESLDVAQLSPRRGGGGGSSSSHRSTHRGTQHSSGGGSSSSSGGLRSSSGKVIPFAVGAGLGLGIAHSSASSFSLGGGPHATLDAGSPFPGREAGGGTRDAIFGTSRYGSGWPYGGYGSYVDFRPLPYYFYPLAFHNHYYGSHVYDQHNRPGGNVSTIPILSQDDTLQKQTYHLIGDRSSVLDVYLALRDSNCSIQDTESDLAVYNVDDASHVVQPEQVVQWYRASSFALSMDSYNNSASSLALMPQNNDTAALPSSADSPYPADTDLDFLGCLNITIGQSVPLIDYTNNNSDTGLAFGIFIGIISGVLLCLCLGMWCHRRRRARRTRKTVEDGQQAGVVVKGEKTEAKAITLDGTKEYKTIDDSKSVPAEDIQDVMQRPEPSVLPTSEPIPKRQSQSTPK